MPTRTAAVIWPTVLAVLFRPRLRDRRILIRSSTNPTAPSVVARKQHQQTRGRRAVAVERQAGQVGAEVARPDAGQDRDPAHRRRAALGLVARRAVLADLVAEALPVEQPDQHRGQQDRHRQRDADGDAGCRSSGVAPACPAASESASAPSPAALEALTSTTSPGCSSARSKARAASASATRTAPPPTPRPFHDRAVVHGAHRPPRSDDNESRHI